MERPLIELRGVSKAFGKKVIFDNIDLQIYQGEAVGVIGPSGTGKSTVLRIIAGLLAPDRGDVYICGHKRRGTIEQGEDPLGVGLVFQQSALFDSLTVGENVGFDLYRHSRLSRKRIHELVEETLTMVGLPDSGKLYPSEISGGMRKRVSLARAIIRNPDDQEATPNILLYDEPTAGLDPIVSTRIEMLIDHLLTVEKACSTYLVVTHQDTTIRNTSSRIVFLYEGKIQWDGNTKDAYVSEHPLLKQFFTGSIEGPI